MAKILHIKDAYFELPEKCKDDISDKQKVQWIRTTVQRRKK